MASDKCRKCGNPEGYDTFWREDPPFYSCGKCGEREKPEPSPSPADIRPGRCPKCNKVYLKHDGYLWCPTCQTDEQDKKYFFTIQENERLVAERDALKEKNHKIYAALESYTQERDALGAEKERLLGELAVWEEKYWESGAPERLGECPYCKSFCGKSSTQARLENPFIGGQVVDIDHCLVSFIKSL